VRTISSLAELLHVLTNAAGWPVCEVSAPRVFDEELPDMADVRGQMVARLALEVAAAGFHHLMMVGPPGAGKSMLAKRLPGLLPRLNEDEAFTVALTRSAAGLPVDADLVTSPPFRAPHHSISMIGMIGGGSTQLRPGEITLASEGVLFLDEMGEFAPTVLDALRQPLEDQVVRISRAQHSVTMPARFLLVAATNPCPCGGATPMGCTCPPSAVQRYVRRFSGPLLDRFDLRIQLVRTATSELTSTERSESSAVIAERVARVHEAALARQGCMNAHIGPEMLDEVAPLESDALAALRGWLDNGSLSGRGYHRVRRVARTLADLEGHEGAITRRFVDAAVSLRCPIRTDAASVR
jgi:magnesium chelatase family protein